ncbi:hypothetical protein PB2503_09589 [Parvularcula bermudensis HTCC2503]|uniref:HEAT repeat domain-containing protein n=1 Tax=Parvularcula bermudensis (strain ATCC BAA-594 / HTCC2503 / KCTC 12087) TaxID=314260 RepID=E0TDE7_PARBH|nr:hypothetical protein [Parvularcula bermudensis]ADM09970.1 hypothetical protein PB2503_09589 [Parvularcula bermudensis HTCC2503]
MRKTFLGVLGAALLPMGAAAQMERVAVDDSAFALGTLNADQGALPETLWQGADRDEVETLLMAVPDTFSEPLYRELLRRVLLSPGAGPERADNALAGQKFLKVARAGYYRDAASLAGIVSGSGQDPALSQVVAYKELLDGEVDQACARGEALREGRSDPFWITLRYVCYAHAGEDAAADLTLGLLRRQGTLTTEQIERLAAFAGGESLGVPPGTPSVFDWTIMQLRGVRPDASFLMRAGPAITAAAARSDFVPDSVRERALLMALAGNMIGAEEAVRLVDGMEASGLANSLVILTSLPPQSLEQAEELGRALAAGGTDYEERLARARLYSRWLGVVAPVDNYAPYAAEIALAAMMVDQDRVAERWILALAADATSGQGRAVAERLVQVYAERDPNAARRIASYLEMEISVESPTPFLAIAREPELPVASLVARALETADAEGQALPALIYLAGTNTRAEGEGDIRATVLDWSRQHADLSWLDRYASFRAEAEAFLAGDRGGAGRPPEGSRTPSLKPRQ